MLHAVQTRQGEYSTENLDEAIVYVVDDDKTLRDSLCDLLASVDVNATPYESAQAFLESYDPGVHACAIVDVRMPQLSGIGLQRRLNAEHSMMPVIMLTAYPDPEVAVEAMKQGAFDFLLKPVRDQQLIDLVMRALDEDLARREATREQKSVSVRMRRLSPRERQVLSLLVGGLTNKEIGAQLDITKRTVELHRVHVMKKMRASTVAELVAVCTRHHDVLDEVCAQLTEE